MAEKRSVDPRFDPRFQRGDDPAMAPASSSAARPADPKPARVPPAEPGVPVGQSEPARAAEPDRLNDPTDPTDDPTDELDDESAPVTGRNPFRLALLIVSVALLAIAAAMLWWSASNQS